MWKKVRWIVAFVVTFVLVCALIPGGLPFGNIGNNSPTDPARTANAETVEHVPYEVLASAGSMSHAREIADAYGLELKSYSYGIAVFVAPNAEEAVELSRQMEQDGIPPLSLNLLYTYNTDYHTYTEKLLDTPYEDGYKNNYRYEPENTDTDIDLATSTQWHHDEMDTEYAWSEEVTGEGVLVAVIDTGIDTDHPAFEGRISELSYNSHTDEVGLDYVDDIDGHGTHVSGIVAASFNDEDVSVYGVAPDATILAIKADIPTDPGWFDMASLLRGINYAVENGADIINMSLGRPFDGGYDELEHQTIADAVESGVTVICAAGNDSDDHAGYPAAYDEAIAVAATRQGYLFDDWYSGSNYGSEIDIAAPGGEIYSTNAPGSNIANYFEDQSNFIAISGTSMASPNVAGVAALVKSMNPDLKPGEVRAILCETARDLGELGRDDLFGAGIVNAYAAVLGQDNLLEVTFDYNDEGGRESVVVKVIPGYTLFEPAIPTWAGHAFMGWFDSETGGEFNFGDVVENELSLYAQWIDAEPGMYVTEFPDVNFRNAVLSMLNERYGGSRKESDFIEGDMDLFVEIEYLYLPNLRIRDMTGLKYFTELLQLTCMANQLTELDVSANTKLTYLDCDFNNLTQLDLSKNTVLEDIYCSSNMLAEIDVSKNTELIYFSCSRNQLAELDVTKNTELKMLDCSFNELTELDVTKNTKLSGGAFLAYDEEDNVIGFSSAVGLDCSFNLLTSLDVSKNAELGSLECNYNQLTELDLSGNPALTLLRCFENQLTELDLSNNPDLMALDCGENELTELDVSGNAALIDLYCWGNNLVELDVSSNVALESLVCGGNRLTELDLSGNDALLLLNCGYNYLTELDVSDNVNLEMLLCDYNYMESPDKVSGWEPNPALIWDVTFIFDPQMQGDMPSGKDITASFKDPGFLAAVRDLIGKPEGAILDYDVAKITYLNLSPLGTEHIISDLSGIEYFCLLDDLECYDQQLETLDLSKNTMLLYVHCAGNKLTELDVSNNTKLKILICFDNELEALDISNNKALSYLDCSDNRMLSTDDVIGWQEQGLILHDTFIFNLQKGEPVPVISITTQPAEKTTLPKGSSGHTLSITAEVTGDYPLEYEWYSCESDEIGSGVGTLIEGATSNTLTIPDTLEIGTYYYFCIVWVPWAVPVTSDIATVEITATALESIAVTALPDKTAYDINETLDLTGLAVTATYTDGSTADITADITVNPANGAILSTAGIQTVNISYTEDGVTRTTSFTVAVAHVMLESIAPTNLPTKTTYTEGEKLDLAGLAVTATYSDGSSAVVTSFTTDPINGTVLDTVGPLTVNVSYTEEGVTKTTSFDITVNAAPVVLDSIAVTGQITKSVYTVGDMFDLGGLIVTATYSDGSTAVITNFTTDLVNGTVLDTAGPLTVAISYTEEGVTKTASFDITIYAAPIAYDVLEPFGTYKGSGDCQTKIDADDSGFVRLLIDGKVIDPSNYKITSGSTIVTLKESYLKTLANGTYTIRVEFLDGYAEIKLTINKSSHVTDSTTTPRTGDNNNMVLWFSVSMFALIMITCGAVVYRKKESKFRFIVHTNGPQSRRNS